MVDLRVSTIRKHSPSGYFVQWSNTISCDHPLALSLLTRRFGMLSDSIVWLSILRAAAFDKPPYVASTNRATRYNYELQTSEMFSTAGRTVKSGLVASAVVSSWTWAATLLQSSAVAYQYGVSGPFWYASGATVQIILFATIAIELKRRAPNAHTFLEVIRARYGAVTHIVFMVFGLFTNILVTSMLLTGGSAVVNSVSTRTQLQI